MSEKDKLYMKLYVPSTYIKYPLKNGSYFYISPLDDQILKHGYNSVQGNPVELSKFYLVMERIWRESFRRNTFRMSEVLREVYSLPEYDRSEMYKYLPFLKGKPRTRQKQATRLVETILRRGIIPEVIEELHRQMAVKQPSEPLGSRETEERRSKRIHQQAKRLRDN